MKDITSNPNGSGKQPLPSKPSQVETTPDAKVRNNLDKQAGPDKGNLVDTSGYKELPSPISGDKGMFHNK